MAMLTNVNGATGTLRISAIAMTPPLAMRCSSASSLGAEPPLQRACGRSGGPTPKVALAASSVPTAEQTKPSTGPSATTVAPISARIGTETTLASDEHCEHERHAPRAAAQRLDRAATTRVPMSAELETEAARSRTTAAQRLPIAPSSASTHFNGRQVAQARGLRNELLGRHDALGIAELYDEVDAGRLRRARSGARF